MYWHRDVPFQVCADHFTIESLYLGLRNGAPLQHPQTCLLATYLSWPLGIHQAGALGPCYAFLKGHVVFSKVNALRMPTGRSGVGRTLSARRAQENPFDAPISVWLNLRSGAIQTVCLRQVLGLPRGTSKTDSWHSMASWVCVHWGRHGYLQCTPKPSLGEGKHAELLLSFYQAPVPGRWQQSCRLFGGCFALNFFSQNGALLKARRACC